MNLEGGVVAVSESWRPKSMGNRAHALLAMLWLMHMIMLNDTVRVEPHTPII